MKKVIIIHDEPLTKKNCRNFFIDELLERKILVEYWGIHKLLYGNLHLADELKETYYSEIFSFEHLKEVIKKNVGSLFIVDFTVNIVGYRVLYLLTKYRCRIAYLGIFTSINLTLKEKVLNMRYYGFNKIKPYIKKIPVKFVVNIAKYLFPLRQPDVFFYCGNASIDKISGKQKVPINSFDYEDYVYDNGELPVELRGGKFAVFLDQYLPYHPDLLLLNNKTISPSSYFVAMNRFFARIEQLYSLKVVIAAHPKANYQSSIFDGRLIYKYRTATLVKHSLMVFAHASLSISFAVLNYKPIIFLYMSDFYNLGTNMMILMQKMAALLRSNMVCINSSLNDQELLFSNVDHKRYDLYKYKYLTSKDSEKKRNVDIICSVLKTDM